MLYTNNLLGVICFKKPQCGVPEDMSLYETPVLTRDKQYVMQLLVVVCDLLSNVLIAVFGSTSP